MTASLAPPVTRVSLLILAGPQCLPFHTIHRGSLKKANTRPLSMYVFVRRRAKLIHRQQPVSCVQGATFYSCSSPLPGNNACKFSTAAPGVLSKITRFQLASSAPGANFRVKTISGGKLPLHVSVCVFEMHMNNEKFSFDNKKCRRRHDRYDQESEWEDTLWQGYFDFD
jgi:hypothetical protein